MKKFFILCLMVLVMCVNANAQERVNGVKYSFNNGTSNLQQITQWYYNDRTGEWNDYGGTSLTLSIKTFIHNNETHYVLCLQKLTGEYRGEVWRPRVVYYSALISENDYKVITNSNEGFYTFKFYYDYTSRKVDEEEYDENRMIRGVLISQNEKLLSLEVSILFYKDVVRFNTSKDSSWGLKGAKELKNHYYEVSKAEWSKLTIE